MLITSQRIGVFEHGSMSDLLTVPRYMPPSEALMLECWTCSRRKEISSKMYRYGKPFDLGEAVLEVGWIAAIDFRRRRKLAFCSAECEDRAKTKEGMFRFVRPR